MSKYLILLVLLVTLVPLTATAQTDDPPIKFENIVWGADFPVSLVFTPDGRLLYTEKENGNVRMVDTDHQLLPEPVITLPTDGFVERGMLGIELDPNFADNGYIWLFYTQPNTIEPPYPVNKVVRFHLEGNTGTAVVEMLSEPVITRVGHHMGGNLRFDENGYLYVSMGDIGEASFAQDLTVMPGKIHRFAVVDDALVPAPDNPFDDSSVFAYGLRNPFDFDIDPETGYLVASENGPACDDELNLILPGGNYGWRPDYPCDDNNPQSTGQYIYPLASWTPTIAPTGILIYDGEMFPEWAGDVFFCAWNTGQLRRAEMSASRDSIAHTFTVQIGERNCLTDVEVAPDGSIYITDRGAIYRISRDDD